jgi:hypothetical protein
MAILAAKVTVVHLRYALLVTPQAPGPHNHRAINLLRVVGLLWHLEVGCVLLDDPLNLPLDDVLFVRSLDTRSANDN